MKDEKLVSKVWGEISGELRTKLGKLIAGKMSASEFDAIIHEAVRAELGRLRTKVFVESGKKEREKNVQEK